MFATGEAQKWGFKGMRFSDNGPADYKVYPKDKEYDTCWWSVRPE